MIQHIPRDLINRVPEELEKITKSFRFDFGLFKISKRNKGIKPYVMPIVHFEWISRGRFPTKEEVMYVVKNHPDYCVAPMRHPDTGNWLTPEDVLNARVSMNFMPGFYREAHVMSRLMEIDPAGDIWYDTQADMDKGRVDIEYSRSRDKAILRLAVGHEGETSDFYDDLRKAQKEVGGLIKLIAPNDKNNPGLHLVRDEDIWSLV